MNDVLTAQRVTVEFDPGEGAIGRIVGLVERRGYELRGLTMAPTGTRAALTLDLAARDAGRQFAILDLQLRRLVGVRNVSTSPCPGSAA
ncbi:MAG: ACT domain-containing protein [Sphingomicrobium sp.]